MDRARHNKEPVEPVSIEAWVLTEFKYADLLGKPIPKTSPGGETGVLAEDFLNAYPKDSPHRQDTQDLLEWFRDADPAHPHYQVIKDDISRHLKALFGPPPEAE